MKYERAFEIIKSEEKTPVIKIDELLEIIDNMEIEMGDVEIHDMLRYFHNNGSILFFNMDRLREIIILDIQWFVDCFKDIITDQGHAKQRNGEIHKKCLAQSNLFFETGLLDSSLYENLLTANSVTLPEEHREILGKYLEKLGMMIYLGKFNTRGFHIPYANEIDAWYVPCVNTKEFKPEKEKYENTEASPILCFRFNECLPMDLFGRMIVLCLSSGKWQIVGEQLCREGAHMRFCDTEEKNLNQVDVYLFTTRELVTVQIINRAKPKLHGKGVKAEIQNIIEELQTKFYACLQNCEIGFLCSKEKGYDESSVKHFIPMTSGREYCDNCSIEALHVDVEQACDFWGVSSEEVSKSKNDIQLKIYISN
ncbi:uncharacterized protein LOC130050722 [Ostrea edulis]|uniref:uncharacterized protein LOC130050722 n=1 Tax=Ostrea edulis TaxID=37623 RepID=UPI0024AF8259|nr:uncharacterized protein LOC130050722 [Ostrea edulis]